MQKPSSHRYPEFASKDTATSRRAFVETTEHSRFVEFCDACRQFRYWAMLWAARHRQDAFSGASQPRRSDHSTGSMGLAKSAMTFLSTRRFTPCRWSTLRLA